MNDDDKDMLKNLDLLINLELVQNEVDWEVIQNLQNLDAAVIEAQEKAKKNAIPMGQEFDSPDELKLEGE